MARRGGSVGSMMSGLATLALTATLLVGVIIVDVDQVAAPEAAASPPPRVQSPPLPRRPAPTSDGVRWPTPRPRPGQRPDPTRLHATVACRRPTALLARVPLASCRPARARPSPNPWRPHEAHG